MLTKIKKALSKSIGDIARARGYEIRRIPDSFLFLSRLSPRTVLDIGANEGQFASKVRVACPETFIHSFEPIPSVYARLVSRFSADSRFHAYNIGLGDNSSTATINTNEFSPSSSLLDLSSEHVSRFPFAARSVPESIKIVRLDSWAGNIELIEPIVAKIDVQGYEERVITGGLDTLARCQMVIIEVSFIELYSTQLLFDELHLIMVRNGFRCAGLLDCYADPKTGEFVYADAVYMRKS